MDHNAERNDSCTEGFGRNSKKDIIMKKIIILFMGLITIFSCEKQSKTTDSTNNPAGKNLQKKENLAGGWKEVSLDKDVEAALDFALEEIYSKAKLKNVLSAKKQVVKGLNYDLTFSLENGETWNVIVYRDLEGNFILTKKAKINTPIPAGESHDKITNEEK
jgi:hypothetical protein